MQLAYNATTCNLHMLLSSRRPAHLQLHDVVAIGALLQHALPKVTHIAALEAQARHPRLKLVGAHLQGGQVLRQLGKGSCRSGAKKIWVPGCLHLAARAVACCRRPSPPGCGGEPPAYHGPHDNRFPAMAWGGARGCSGGGCRV